MIKQISITADIDVPQGGAEGMILTSGGRFGGYGFYLLKGKPVFLWNLVDLERIKWEGTAVLAPGQHVLEFDCTSNLKKAWRKPPTRSKFFQS